MGKTYFGLGRKEADIYSNRSVSNKITQDEITSHWEMRALRKGIQSILSARFSEKSNQKISRKEKEKIFAFLNPYIKPTFEVLEIGTGIGRMTKELSARVKSVVTTDISARMIRRAKINLKNVRNVKFRLGRILDLKLKPRSFDLVFETRVLIHILDFKEFQRTINLMKKLSDRIFISEHMYNTKPDLGNKKVSIFSIVRKRSDYINAFKPFRLVKAKKVNLNDPYTFMFFEKSKKD